MKKQFSLNELISKNIAIHCNTKEEVDMLLDKLNESNIPLTEKEVFNFFDKYKSETCYTISPEIIDGVYYQDVNHFQEEGYEIIDFADLEIL